MSIQEVAQMWNLGAQTIRDYRNAFLVQGMASLAYKRPPGRPSKLTTTQRRELAEWIKAGPQAAGYMSELVASFPHSPGLSDRRIASEDEGRSSLDFPLI